MRTNVSGMKIYLSCDLLDVVSSSHWGSISTNKGSPRQHVQVVVLRRVSGTLEHVQHPLGDQETTCIHRKRKKTHFQKKTHFSFDWMGKKSCSLLFIFVFGCWTSNQQCWWRTQRQQQERDPQEGWRVWDLHPSAPDLQLLSDLSERTDGTEVEIKIKLKIKKNTYTVFLNLATTILYWLLTWDGVGDRHEGWVQSGGHAPHSVVSHNPRQAKGGDHLSEGCVGGDDSQSQTGGHTYRESSVACVQFFPYWCSGKKYAVMFSSLSFFTIKAME